MNLLRRIAIEQDKCDAGGTVDLLFDDVSTALRLLVEVARWELELTSAKANYAIADAGTTCVLSVVEKLRNRVVECQTKLDKAMVAALANPDCKALLEGEDETG